MKRKVYLIGEIEKRFGSEFSMYADNYGEIIRNIDCNRPGFKKYLAECHRDGIGFTINFAGKYIQEEKELLTPLKEGDVTIAAVPAGSKSEMGMVILGAVLIVAGFMTAGTAWAALEPMLIGMGMSIAMQGIQAMMAPDPATEPTEEEGYLYSGSESIVVEGDPVPLLYGKLRVPGQTVSAALNTAGMAAEYPGQGDPVDPNNLTGSGTDGQQDEPFPSDIRLKENIVQIGLVNGFNIYSWNWNKKGIEIGANKYPTVGVLAQEILKIKPDAVALKNGYYAVNYSKLGIN